MVQGGARAARAQRVLLEGAIDYAGLYPPASLGVADAARNYLEYALSPDAWALGRFVVSVLRLEELRDVAEGLVGAGLVPWRLSVVAGASPDAEVLQLRRFLSAAGPGWTIDAVEANPAGNVQALRPLVANEWRLYVEVSLGEPIEPSLAAVRDLGANAKFRTGGVTADVFPDPRQLARAILACARSAVPFKATAGLHHPLRAEYRLTYALDSASGTMFGYLNVLLAAALAWRASGEDMVAALLDERDPAAFALGDDVLRWRDQTFGMDEMREVRTRFMHGFGSCSFREPMDEFMGNSGHGMHA